MVFSKSRHEAVSVVEKCVQKVKYFLETSQIMEQFKVPNLTTSEMETILAITVSTINSRPLAIIDGIILSPLSFGQHDFTISSRVATDDVVAMISEVERTTETSLSGKPDALSDEIEPQQSQLRQYKKALSTMATRINKTYETLSVNLLPKLLRSYGRSGIELNRNQFNSDHLKLGDIVFDPITYTKSGDIRASIFRVIHMSENNKSLVIARPKLEYIRKSKYPNKSESSVDSDYTRGAKDCIIVSRDARHLNFICHGPDKDDLISFDPTWKPLDVRDLMENLLRDTTATLNVASSIITNSDKIDVKSFIRTLPSRKPLVVQEAADTAPSVDQDFEYVTRSGRTVVKPDRLSY